MIFCGTEPDFQIQLQKRIYMFIYTPKYLTRGKGEMLCVNPSTFNKTATYAIYFKRILQSIRIHCCIMVYF